jgi:tRNA dimethylallyltransferase
MDLANDQPILWIIVGCTASGKGAVGRELAGRLGGEILSVDSMKIYRRMDIGTAKPTAEQRAAVPHHGLDLAEPSESFSVARWLEAADRAVAEITARGKIPLAVGGTTLYLKALLEGLFEGPPADEPLRAELESRADEEGSPLLHAELQQVDPLSAGRIHPNDRKRIIRALEVFRTTGQPISQLQQQWDAQQRRYPARLIGLRRQRDDQNRRINARVKTMVERGLRDEVAALLGEPDGLSEQAAQAVGYAELIDHFAGRVDFEKAIENIKINTRRLAKKQRTWQRRFADVHWFDLTDEQTVASAADRILQEVPITP